MTRDERERRPQPEIDPEALRAFAETFLPTFEYFPQQNPDGSYRAVYAPFTLHLVEQHLRGNVTTGAYALNRENQAKWFCFDADDDNQWAELKTLKAQLEQQKLPAYLERSRRGGHLWMFFPEPLKGTDIRRFGRHLRITSRTGDGFQEI